MPGGGSLHPPTHETVDQKMHCVHQVGPQVFKYAVRRMAELACQLLESNGYSTQDVKIVVPHQANLRIIRAMQERLGVDDSKILINIDRYANTTGRNHSAWTARRRRAEAAVQRRSRTTGRGGRRLYHRRRADALGLLRSANRRKFCRIAILQAIHVTQ